MWLPKIPDSELASSMPPATPAAVPSAPRRKLPPADGNGGLAAPGGGGGRRCTIPVVIIAAGAVALTRGGAPWAGLGACLRAGAGSKTGLRGGGMLGLAGAEDRAQKPAALFGAVMVAGVRFELADAVFQFLDMVGRGFQALFLHDHGLGQIVGGVGLFAGCLVYQGLGIPVARRGGGGADTVEKGSQKLAFFR
jgi:hypothetical protein